MLIFGFSISGALKGSQEPNLSSYPFLGKVSSPLYIIGIGIVNILLIIGIASLKSSETITTFATLEGIDLVTIFSPCFV